MASHLVIRLSIKWLWFECERLGQQYHVTLLADFSLDSSAKVVKIVENTVLQLHVITYHTSNCDLIHLCNSIMLYVLSERLKHCVLERVAS